MSLINKQFNNNNEFYIIVKTLVFKYIEILNSYILHWEQYSYYTFFLNTFILKTLFKSYKL